jgi:hypothetical protein
MERGTWTLKCQRCEQLFEVEVKPGERVVEYAKEATCPHCYRAPDSTRVPIESETIYRWHQIIACRNPTPR